LEPNKVDVALYLAKWKPTGLATYRPHDVAAQTFEAALKELFVAIHKNPAAPDTALEANDITQDILEVVLKLRTNLAVVTRIRNDLAAIAKNFPATLPVRRTGETQAAREAAHPPKNHTTDRDRQRFASRIANASALEATVQELRDRQSEQTEQSYSDRRQRSCSWLAKALRVNDPADPESRFIFSWIALNALYGVSLSCLECVSAKPRKTLKQGRDDLFWFIDSICRLDSDEKRISSVLSRHATTVDKAVGSLFLLRDYWEVNKASDAQLEKKKQDDQKKIADARKTEDPLRSIRILNILLVSRLRTMRNQFIHGAATDGPVGGERTTKSLSRGRWSFSKSL
jgi:hypothetical protein